MNDRTIHYVNLIKSLGYRVFMRKRSVPLANGEEFGEYCFFTDGTRIGYAQWSGLYDGVSTVHKPSRGNGTGFGGHAGITPESIEWAASTITPGWARRSDGPVTKYKGWDEYLAESEWNRGLEEV